MRRRRETLTVITFSTEADIGVDRQVLVTLPPETPIGKADLVVMVNPQGSEPASSGRLRSRFGTVHSGDPRSADNERIDAELARIYGNSAQ